MSDINDLRNKMDAVTVERAAPVVDSLVALTIADHALMTGAIKPSL